MRGIAAVSGLSCDAKSDAYILPGSSEADRVPYGFQNSHCRGAGDDFLSPEFIKRGFSAFKAPVVAPHLVPDQGSVLSGTVCGGQRRRSLGPASEANACTYILFDKRSWSQRLGKRPRSTGASG